MRNPKYRIFLILTAVLLCFSFISTPITALVPTAASGEASDIENKTPITTSGDEAKIKETPVTTGDVYYIEKETPTEEWFSEESTADSTTRGNDEKVESLPLTSGVYAFRNIGNGSLWMDLQENIISYSAHIQQCNYATPPTELFERAALFKITRVGTTNRYIIRLMMNNLLTFDYVEEQSSGIIYVKTKRIPANDSEVSINDTFYI